MSAARHDGGRQQPLLRRGLKRDCFNQMGEHLHGDRMSMAEGILVRGFDPAQRCLFVYAVHTTSLQVATVWEPKARPIGFLYLDAPGEHTPATATRWQRDRECKHTANRRPVRSSYPYRERLSGSRGGPFSGQADCRGADRGV